MFCTYKIKSHYYSDAAGMTWRVKLLENRLFVQQLVEAYMKDNIDDYIY